MTGGGFLAICVAVAIALVYIFRGNLGSAAKETGLDLADRVIGESARREAEAAEEAARQREYSEGTPDRHQGWCLRFFLYLLLIVFGIGFVVSLMHH